MRRLTSWLAQPWFWHVFSLLGGLTFAYQGWFFAHHQLPSFDEGLYLYKGLLFVQGDAQPFQPYGPLTNHMPLAYLLPGIVQAWHPGLDVGRALALLMSLGMLGGLWWAAMRWANERWAAMAVWAFALSPSAAMVYSQAISQSLVALLGIWSIAVLAEREDDPASLLLAGLLSGMLVLTRINMAPFWILLGLGLALELRSRSLWYWGASLLVIVALHLVYAPRIFWLWARWLPKVVWSWVHWTPPWLFPKVASDPPLDFASRFGYFTDAVIRFPLAWASLLIATLALGAIPAAERNTRRYRLLLWGTATVWVLLAFHFWVTLIKSYCPDCFPLYTAFYAPLWVLMGGLALSLPWEPKAMLRRWAALIPFLFLLSIGYHLPPTLRAFDEWTHHIHWEAGIALSKRLLWFPAAHLPAWRDKPMDAIRLLYSALALGGWLLLGALPLLLGRPRRLGQTHPRTLWVIGLALLGLLAPSPLMSHRDWFPKCDAYDVLQRHRAAGEALAAALPPPGTPLYWGMYDASLLLYARYPLTHPQQLNGRYNLRLDWDPDALARWGYWSPGLQATWLRQAQAVLAPLAPAASTTVTAPALHYKALEALGFTLERTYALPACWDHDHGWALYLRR